MANMRDEKVKKIFRLLPCNKNDILALEQWLEDMATEGYMLQKIFLSVAVFVKAEPAMVRYRFVAKPANKLFDVGGQPTVQENFIALREQEGWRHVTDMMSFFIFRTKDVTAPEPERDLYAIAYDGYHEARKNLVMDVCAILCLIVPVGRLDIMTLGTMISFGTLIYLLMFWILLFHTGSTMVSVLQWKKTKNSLESEDINCSDWQDSAGRTKAITMMVYLITAVLFIGSVGTYLYNVHPSNTMAIEQCKDNLPIPKLSEWYTDAVFVVPEEEVDYANYNVLEKRSDLLAPVVLQIDEHGELYRGDMLLFAGGVDAEYYEMILPELAKPLAMSLHEEDKKFGEKYNRYQLLETPDVSADYIIAYDSWVPSVVLVEGNKVVHVQIDQEGGTEVLTVDKLAQIYADYLLSENSATK